MFAATMALVGGLTLLVLGADRFVVGAAGMARSLGVSPLIIGLTVVGIATSMPEVLVGGVAAWDGKTPIAIGNALGSNIANVGLVLGATALCSPLLVCSRTLRREYVAMLLAMLCALALMFDLQLDRSDGLMLLLTLALIMVWIVRSARKEGQDTSTQAFMPQTGLGKALLFVCLGLLALLGGAELLVRAAVRIARVIGVSDLVIGLTVIAVGTSLPELAASLASVVKNHTDIAIGNILGSNMFNMLMVLGIPCIIHPDGFGKEVLLRDFSVMAGLSLAMGWMIFYAGKNKVNRWEGVLLLLCFAGYQYWLFQGQPGAL